MATTRKTRASKRRTASSKATQRRASASARSANTARPRKTTASRSSKTSRNSPLRTHLGRQANDVWGLAFIVLGVICALGIVADSAGPFGRFVDATTSSFVGDGNFVLPFILVAVGVVLIRGRRPEDGPRVAIGSAFLMIAICGILHVLRVPKIELTFAQLQSAGGVFGWAVGQPLRGGLGEISSVAVFLAVGSLGLLIVARAELRYLAALCAHGVRLGWYHLRLAVARVAGAEPADPVQVNDEVHEEANPPRRRAAASVIDLEAADALQAQAPKSTSEQVETNVSENVDGHESLAPVVPLAKETKQYEFNDKPKTKGGRQLAKSVPKGAWKLPAMNLLSSGGDFRADRRGAEFGARALEEALAAHGVDAEVRDVTIGPTVTRYELELGEGVRVAKVTNLNRDIAYAMASPDVRILAPIPGKSRIGVEVPNRQRHLVTLGDILNSQTARGSTHVLDVAVGMDIDRAPVLADLASAPHMLIAGATGAGKSSAVNSIITSILMRSTPDEVRMILIDPKRVEMAQYDGLPHLLTRVVVDPKKAANALQWAVTEMDRRYSLLAEVGFRDVSGYNSAIDRGDFNDELFEDEMTGEMHQRYSRLPYIVVIVDELNDLMMVAARDVEASICRIAQMARAVGVHLIIATQRPSVNVITGVIKANVPSRMAFSVASAVDSKVILDQQGAERLVGKGDMLLSFAGSIAPQRIQGAWVSEEEVRSVAAFWRRQSEPLYVDGVEGEAGGGTAELFGDEGEDDLLDDAMEIVVREQKGSTSMLQRKMKVGFARAGRLMDLLERRGVVGPGEGSKARAVLMTPEELAEVKRRVSGAS